MEEDKSARSLAESPATTPASLPAGSAGGVGGRRARAFSARITGLRMATTYSFEVRPVRRDARDLADPQSIGSKIIIVPTKGCKL